MRLKLTLRRPAGDIDLAATVSSTTTIGALATAVSPSDTAGTMRLISSRDSAPLDPATVVTDTGLRSGVVVEVVPASGVAQSAGAPAATVRVLRGPDAGLEVAIPNGSSTVGRARDSRIRLSDPLVSKHHARIVVGDTIEVVDDRSANGIVIDGRSVSRSAVHRSDVVVIGDTQLAILPIGGASTAEAVGATAFNRSPRVVPWFAERRFKAPAAPKRPPAEPFPWLAMLAPLVMGVALFAITRQLYTVLFIALSPLLALGVFLDQRIRSRRTRRAQVQAFTVGIARFEEVLEQTQRVERATREGETPSLADAITAVEHLGPLTWTRRPEHADFLTARLGLGTDWSRCRIEADDDAEALPEYAARVAAMQARFARIDDVPIAVDLRSSGGLGVAGPTDVRGPVARSVVLQLAALHSPAEVVIAAVVSSRSRQSWDWLQWLPHTTSPASPISGHHLAADADGVAALLGALEALVLGRTTRGPSLRGRIDAQTPRRGDDPVPAVVVVVEDDGPFDRARIVQLAERGPDAGIHVVWCSAELGSVPAAARTFIEVADPDRATAGRVRDGALVFPVRVAGLTVAEAERLARRLSPVADAGAPTGSDEDVPTSVGVSELLGQEVLDDAAAIETRWRETRSITSRDGAPAQAPSATGGLRASIGVTASEVLTIDLRRDGPHALVGGTTGSGKSEFLQTWVLSLAASYSPDRLTFLFVDYKGGAAFAECVALPHTVGLVTDLSPHLVRRALTSLRAEVRRREHLLNEKRAKDLVTLESRGDPDTPPNLVIVVDEFAALVHEFPEFVDGMVDVAQRGRSLGLHLILATQRPAGVIKDNLRANTNLRIALRMADGDDSADVLGDQVAARFSSSTPGRAATRTGTGAPLVFQSAYSGGRSVATSSPAPSVERLGFDADVPWEDPIAPARVEQRGPTDITRIVATARAAARGSGIPDPRRPWLDVLERTIDFAEVEAPGSDEQLLLGLGDVPEEQRRAPIFFRPDDDGNLAVFGTGGSGKSTALRSLAVAAAVTPRGGPVQVYALDFGARGLSSLEVLPHVGAVIDGGDSERVERLLRTLQGTIAERSLRFAAANASTVTEYRRLTGDRDEPRILLLLDNLGAFREQYEFTGTGEWFRALAQIATDGRQVGVHVVFTADRAANLPPALASTVQRRVVLRLASEDDYLMLGVQKDVLTMLSPPGRALVDDHEVQLAVLGGDANVAVQARELQRLEATMLRLGVQHAPRVLRLPEQVELGQLSQPTSGVAIGIADIDLEPLVVDLSGPVLVAGPAGSGRSSTAAALALAAARASRQDVAVLAPHAAAVPEVFRRVALATSAADSAGIAEELATRIESGGIAPVVLLPHAPEFANSEAEYALQHLVTAVSRAGGVVVAEGESSSWTQYSTLVQALKAPKTGVMLGASTLEADMVFGVQVGRTRAADFPAGRGFWISRGRAAKVQLARPGGDSSPSTPESTATTFNTSQATPSRSTENTGA